MTRSRSGFPRERRRGRESRSDRLAEPYLGNRQLHRRCRRPAQGLHRERPDQARARVAARLPAGTHWNYSNTGFVLLGVIVRRVTGQFDGDFLHDNVFRPLGMKTARIISEADIVQIGRVATASLATRCATRSGFRRRSTPPPTARSILRCAISPPGRSGSITVASRQRRALQRVRDAESPLDRWHLPLWIRLDALAAARGEEDRAHWFVAGVQDSDRALPDARPDGDRMANLAETPIGPIDATIAGIVEPSLAAPERMASGTLTLQPPALIPALLGRVAKGDATAPITPALRGFMNAYERRYLSRELAAAPSWQTLGCDRLADSSADGVGASSTYSSLCRSGRSPRPRVHGAVHAGLEGELDRELQLVTCGGG